MEPACAKVCNRAELPDSRRFEAPTPSPEPNEWAIGRFPRARPAGTVALSAVCGMAQRRERTATMDIRASDPLGAAEEPNAEAEPHVEAEEPHAEAEQRRAGAAVAGPAAVAVAGIARSGRES